MFPLSERTRFVATGTCTGCALTVSMLPIGTWSAEKRKAWASFRLYGKMEEPGANPQTVHMPMMCQHCNHAPCETVCPVAATTHSNEGVNQMTYNRCIGTRYCANNCPFKVRRFNWFHYPGYDKFQTSTRPGRHSADGAQSRCRGAEPRCMEKCSLCVQRTQSAKLEAKKAGTPLEDGSAITACAEACPTNAITLATSTTTPVRSRHLRQQPDLPRLGGGGHTAQRRLLDEGP